MLAVLAAANILSYLDRIIVNLLVQPIKADLGISDTQFGMLQGLAFGLFYTLLALPIGRLVDSRPRKIIIAAGVFVFSLCSLLSGLARSFGQLFAARVGVGAGEASLAPAAFSMIADLFPPERLGRAMSVFTMTAFIGIGLAYVAGGATVALVGAAEFAGWPLLPDLAGWQRVFVLVAIPGLLLAPVILVMPEPARRGRGREGAVPLADAAGHVLARRAALLPFFAGFAFITLSSYASAVWTPALFTRAYQWTPAEVGLGYGLVTLLLAPLGALAAGRLCDMLAARGVTDAPLRVAAFGYLGTGLFGGLAPLMPSGELALAMFAPSVFLGTMPYPMAATALQLATPNELRGQVSALYMLVINTVGLGLGPVIVGALSDQLFTGPDGVRYGLALVNAACAPLAMAALLLALRPYRAIRAAAA
ncbi:spinster family MFS transporter [Thermaurantiacus tibetensis]|uniref:spinster family MFS transporter n=1 Tax=Thermaurantiacus tibetensis TaxID=2759035 RepID=UPI0018906094|nr:MFS transporter [Thermaurantiacus tibetensis]